MKKKEKIMLKVFNHLQQNPDQSQTLENITKWWLESEKVDVAVDEVATALEGLIKKNSVKRVTEGGNSIYKICKKQKQKPKNSIKH